MVGPEYRKLAPPDAPAMYELRMRGLREDPAAFGSSYEHELTLTDDQIIARATPSPDRFSFGAFVEGTLVGMVTIVRGAHPKVRHVAGIAGMIVAPEYRRHGVGRSLVEAIIEAARAEMDGLEQVTLDVIVGENDAQAFYRSLGFDTFGLHQRAIRDGDTYRDVVLMFRNV